MTITKIESIRACVGDVYIEQDHDDIFVRAKVEIADAVTEDGLAPPPFWLQAEFLHDLAVAILEYLDAIGYSPTVKEKPE